MSDTHGNGTWNDPAPLDPSAPPMDPLGLAPAGQGSAQSGYDYAGTSYGYAASLDADAHLSEYIKILHKRRWLVATGFLVVMLLAIVFTFTARPVYRATLQLQIEPENPNVVSFKEVIQQEKTGNDYYQTQYRILQSRALAKRTMDVIGLWSDPEWLQTRAERESFSPMAMVVGSVRTVKNWIVPTTPVERPAGGESAEQSTAIDAFLGNLEVAPVRNSRLVDLRYESFDPVLATKIVNALGRAYIDQDLEFKYTSSKEASTWLSLRLAEQGKQVQESELELQQYREQNDAVSLEDRQNIVVQRLADLNAAVTKARTERIQKEALFQQSKDIESNRAALDTFPPVISNTFIQQMKVQLAELQRQQAQLAEKLGDRHPEMVKVRSAIESSETKLQVEIGKVIQGVQNDYLSAQAQERAMTAALDQQKNEALSLNRRGIDYSALQRNAVSNQQMFQGLLQRTKETGISGELSASNIRIVDAGEEPRAPVRPRKALNMLFGILGGAVVGIGLAFFFEYMDNTIKTPADMKTHLGLTFMGLVPAIPGARIRLVSDGAPSNFIEAMRTVRTNVLFATPDEGGRTIVVTSSEPSEGKTVIATNLAVSLAEAGERVLFIDADMRRPRAHEVFDLPQEPGLSNVIVGNSKASEVVRKTAVRGLWMLPAGASPPNAAELLGSKRFKEFLSNLHAHFEWIIIDSPPVMPVTDAAVVAHLATGVLFVVRSEVTSRHTAADAIEQLTSARAKFLGAILNRVDLEHNAYYYSRYYRRSYSKYYGSTTSASA